jgi:hypothetical protein
VSSRHQNHVVPRLGDGDNGAVTHGWLPRSRRRAATNRNAWMIRTVANPARRAKPVFPAVRAWPGRIGGRTRDRGHAKMAACACWFRFQTAISM